MLRLTNLVVLAVLILTGTSLLIALGVLATDGSGWFKASLLPALFVIGTVGGWFAIVAAFSVLLVAAIILVIQLIRRNGRAFFPEFCFSFANATLGLCGVLFLFFYDRI
jgi:hypothetical protein